MKIYDYNGKSNISGERIRRRAWSWGFLNRSWPPAFSFKT